MRRPLTLAVAVGLLWQAAGVAVPYVIARAVDDGVLPDDRRALGLWCGVLFVLGVLRAATAAARHWWIDRAGIRGAVYLRRRLLGELVDLDEDTAGRLGQGQMIARATSDVDTLDDWVRGIATLVAATFTLLAVGIALIALGSGPAAIGAATVPLTIVLTIRHVRGQKRSAAAFAETNGAFTSAVSELVGGVATVKGLGAEPVVADRVGRASTELRAAAMRLERVEAAWVSMAALVPGLAIAAGVWLIGDLVLAGDLAPGQLLAFVGWMALLVDAAETLTERMIDRGQALAAAERLLEVLQAPPAITDPALAGATPPLPRVGGVRLVEVSVARGGREVLHGVHLDLAPGEWVGVLGATGSGKSSLLRLLPRLADPTAGTVLLDGVAADRVALTELRAHVGYLGQDPALLTGTLAENLRLVAPRATDSELVAALRAAAAGDLLAALPGGLEGHVGAGGDTLSGGQRQRVALARTLLIRPRVLVLDDPTSALDPATEAVLLAGIRTALPDATVLCATHRLATAAAMDRLVVLGEGRVLTVGPAAEVLGDGALGAAVLDLQAVR